MTKRTLTERFESLSIHLQALLVVTVAVLGADLLTIILYGIYFNDRFGLDVVLSTVITVLVGTPITYFVLHQYSQLRQLAGQLAEAVRYDDLTRLPNRNTFFHEAGAILERAGKRAGAGALLFIDIDHFKSINDTFGHVAGDSVIRAVAKAIRTSVRSGDVAGRLGGEEFGVLLTRADRGEALRIAERIRQQIREIAGTIGLGNRTVTASVGISLHRPGQSLDDALGEADRHLYIAKERGRDRVIDEVTARMAA